MIEEIVNITIKRLICRLLIGIAIGGCALVWFQCHGKDEMRAVRNVVYGHIEQIEIVNE